MTHRASNAADGEDELQALLDARTHALGERVKELTCLYRIFRVIEERQLSEEETLRRIVDIIPGSWQYPEATEARLSLGDAVYETGSCAGSRHVQRTDVVSDGEAIGALEVHYLAERPEEDEGPFLREERDLIEAVAVRVARFIEHRRAEETLREQRELLETSQRRLKEFSGRLLSVREEEKRLLAMDLHDEAGSLAVAVNSLLSIAARDIREGALDAALAGIGNVGETFRNGVARLKRLAADLRPPDLDILGPASAVEAYVKRLSAESGVRIDFTRVGDGPEPGEAAAIAVYRTAQEALTNALRHAAPRRVTVRLDCRADGVALEIADDGRGFRIEDADGEDGRMGIIGMRERIETLGGRLDIASTVGRGTAVRFFIPRETEGAAP